MEARLVEYLHHPAVLFSLMILGSVLVACCKEMKELSWNEKVLGGLYFFCTLGLFWFLKSLWKI